MTPRDIKINALICTRSEELKPTTKSLLSYLSRAGVQVKLLINQSSIFEGYQKGFNSLSANPDDIIILCHDDIEIYNSIENFRYILLNHALDKDRGFLGVAGTSRLTESAVWWDHNSWRENKLHGLVIHSNTGNLVYTFYGQPGKAIAMDGLFLAARAEVLDNIGLDKPPSFEGNWDFYDIYYTTKANRYYYNYVVPLFIRHESGGEGINQESWQKNRLAFTKMFTLPMEID